MQRQVTEFLTSTVQALDTVQQAVHLLTCLHLPGQEAALLSLLPVTHLTAASRAPAYTNKIFPDPLDNCIFQEQVVDTDWRQQHQSALLPRFADTLASQSQAAAPPSQGGGLLRATQATQLEFLATQASLPSSLMVSQPQGGPAQGQQEGGSQQLGTWVSVYSVNPTLYFL